MFRRYLVFCEFNIFFINNKQVILIELCLLLYNYSDVKQVVIQRFIYKEGVYDIREKEGVSQVDFCIVLVFIMRCLKRYY